MSEKVDEYPELDGSCYYLGKPAVQRMDIFLDTANLNDIIKYKWAIDGVTTNPALLSREGKDAKELIRQICSVVDGPVSVEVVSTDVAEMKREAEMLQGLHRNVVVKLPAIPAGFEVLGLLRGVRTNVTLIYTPTQALMACKFGATYISPFVGRLDAIGEANLTADCMRVVRNYGFQTKVLAASMRNVTYIRQAIFAGAHVLTVPPDVLEQMMSCELSEVALAEFLAQWNELPVEQRNLFGGSVYAA